LLTNIEISKIGVWIVLQIAYRLARLFTKFSFFILFIIMYLKIEKCCCIDDKEITIQEIGIYHDDGVKATEWSLWVNMMKILLEVRIPLDIKEVENKEVTETDLSFQ